MSFSPLLHPAPPSLTGPSQERCGSPSRGQVSAPEGAHPRTDPILLSQPLLFHPKASRIKNGYSYLDDRGGTLNLSPGFMERKLAAFVCFNLCRVVGICPEDTFSNVNIGLNGRGRGECGLRNKHSHSLNVYRVPHAVQSAHVCQLTPPLRPTSEVSKIIALPYRWGN